MGGMGLIFTPVLARCLLGPPGLSRPMTSIVCGLIATLNSPIGKYNPPHPLIRAICNITMEYPAMLAGYY